MAGVVTEDFVVGRSLEGLSSCQSGDALSEWRSSEQVENGIPSTSPPYWDTDDSDDDGGLKPSELYGKHTWKIEKFSQINKRELRSDAFEVGGYKWYILIYPQGCDVCNHLSLFLCVANHDKLLPGWSHFAQFTIAVVNKDPKKSKYSDTLHRFWKKEHDWGWKKFMELSKVSDGFVEADTLVIRAQVQVIREKADRPFRCLDCQYRRELVRVYLTNVEQICRRFVEERRGKLGKLLEDKTRWSSFCAFWLGMDQNSKRRMSKEKKDMILKVIVKHFFIEKEVTSTLVMDSLYSGLKALEGQSKSKKGKGRLLDGEDTPAPIVQVEKDMFVLVDDVLLLLERAAMEPLPPKDDKGPQNRTKDGSSGEDFTKDSIERDERRLTELGRRTVEIFVLAHIFSTKIEVAYQEAVSLKRQEELIREEEAAWLAESEQKAKRGVEKDKKSKKKQGKQKRNNRKGKDKVKDEKPAVTIEDKQLIENLVVEGRDVLESRTMPEKDDTLEDVSDVSDSECAVDMLQHDSEERDVSPVNWDTDTSEIHHPAEASGNEVCSTLVVQNDGADKRSSSVLDDSSSTCSTDSAPSVAMNGSFRSNSFASFKTQKLPTRGKVRRGKVVDEDYGCPNVAESRPCEAADAGFQNNATSRKTTGSDYSEDAVTSLQDRTKWPELNSVKKEEDEVVLLQRRPSNKDHLNPGTSQEKLSQSPNFPKSPPRSTPAPAVNLLSAINPKSDLKSIHHAEQVPAARKASFNGRQGDKATALANLSPAATVLKPDSSKAPLSPSERINGQQTTGLSRPSSAPIIPGTVSVSPVVSMVQTTAPKAPLLSRSVSATSHLGPDPLALGHAYVPQSYRNAIVGSSLNLSTAGFTQSAQQTSAMTNAPTFSQQASMALPAQMYHQASEWMEPNNVTSGMSFASTLQEEVLGSQPWTENRMRDVTGSSVFDSSSTFRDVLNFDSYRPLNRGSHERFHPELSVGTSGRQVQGALADEFPHLDIINDLLDEEQGLGRAARASTSFQGHGGGPALYSRHYTYPTDMSLPSELGSSGNSCRFDRSRSYPDGGFPQAYGHYEALGEFMPRGNSMPYVNGQIDNMVPNQWQVMGPDLSLLGMSSGMEGYPYGISDYSNMACGVNSYAMFRPSNGH